MATFRKLHTTFWSDPFVESLTDKQKLFYLYLMSNDKTKQSGIYEISLRQMKFETGFSETEVRELLQFFIDNNKIKWSEQTNEIALANWSKYNFSNSPKIVKCIQTELLEVKNTLLIKYVYPMDTLSILYPYPMDTSSQEEKEEEKEEEQVQEEKQKEKKHYTNADVKIAIKQLDKLTELLDDNNIPEASKLLQSITEDYESFDNILQLCYNDDLSVLKQWKQYYTNTLYFLNN